MKKNKSRLFLAALIAAFSVLALGGFASFAFAEETAKPVIDMTGNNFYVVDQVAMSDAYEDVDTKLGDYGGGNSKTRMANSKANSYILWKVTIPADTAIFKVSSCFNTVAFSVSTDGTTFTEKFSVSADLQIADSSNLLSEVTHSGTVYIKATSTTNTFKLRDYVNFSHDGTVAGAGETYPDYYTADGMGFSSGATAHNDDDFYISSLSVCGAADLGGTMARYTDGGFPIDDSRNGKIHGMVATYGFTDFNTIDTTPENYVGAKLSAKLGGDAAVSVYTGTGVPADFAAVSGWQFIFGKFGADGSVYEIDVTNYINDDGGLYVRFSDMTGVSGGGSQVFGLTLTAYYSERDPATVITAVNLAADKTEVTEGTAVTLTASQTPAETTPETIVWKVNGTAVAGQETLTYVLNAQTKPGDYQIVAVVDGVESNTVTVKVAADMTVTAVALSADKTTVTKGTDITFTAAVTPSGATPATVVWKVNDSAVTGESALTFVLDADTEAGTYKVQVTVDGVTSNAVTVTVQAVPGGDQDEGGCKGALSGLGLSAAFLTAALAAVIVVRRAKSGKEN